MKKKVLFFLLLPWLANLVVSCCDCPEPSIRHYTNKTAVVKNLDNSGSSPAEVTSGRVPKAAFGIRVAIVRELTAHRRTSLFMPAAYAYDCACDPPNQLLPKDSITAINVFTLTSFDGSHGAGSEVSDYFKAYNPYYFLSIPDYLKGWSPRLFVESELPTKADLLLMTPPVRTGVYQFRVRLTLSDGRVLQQDTTPIELT